MNCKTKELVILKEYSSKIVDNPFTIDERNSIRTEFKDKVEVHATFDGGQEISAQQFIGYIVLPYLIW